MLPGLTYTVAAWEGETPTYLGELTVEAGKEKNLGDLKGERSMLPKARTQPAIHSGNDRVLP